MEIKNDRWRFLPQMLHLISVDSFPLWRDVCLAGVLAASSSSPPPERAASSNVSGATSQIAIILRTSNSSKKGQVLLPSSSLP